MESLVPQLRQPLVEGRHRGDVELTGQGDALGPVLFVRNDREALFSPAWEVGRIGAVMIG